MTPVATHSSGLSLWPRWGSNLAHGPSMRSVRSSRGWSISASKTARRECCVEHSPTLDSLSSHCLMHRDGTAYIVFRGTQADKKADLIADAKFLPEPWPEGGRVHRGFANAFQAIQKDVDDWITCHAGWRIIITGHSLGAAMATLLASRHPSAELVTFGSPRVGNAAFARLFAARAPRRYVDFCDLVTRVPPALVGFRHAGPRLYLDRTGKRRAVPASMVSVFLDRMAARLDFIRRYALRPGNTPARALSDHAPINYVSVLLGIREV
jgi:pimeloyl-ACP methyl ester carboxylesterase